MKGACFVYLCMLLHDMSQILLEVKPAGKCRQRDPQSGIVHYSDKGPYLVDELGGTRLLRRFSNYRGVGLKNREPL